MNIDEALEYAQNALERAFEDWLETERPSGDCESVHRQWDNSYARLELVDELQPVMALTAEVRRLHEENERLRKDAATEAMRMLQAEHKEMAQQVADLRQMLRQYQEREATMGWNQS